MTDPTPGQDPAKGDPPKADPPKADPPAPKEFQPITSQEEVDRIVQTRLAREREKYADYEDVKAKAAEHDKLVQSQKTELQKATESQATAEKKAADAELRALRLEVAAEKGLTPAQAKRLMGTTKEELEADADELVTTFKPGDPGKPPTGRVAERLSGGGDPSDKPEVTKEELLKDTPRL